MSAYKKITYVFGMILFSFFASSSYSEEEITAFVYITIGVVVLAIIIYAIVEYVKKKNLNKRNEIKKEFEYNLSEFKISDKIGDDRCSIYLDRNANKLKVIAITTEGITEKNIEHVTGDILFSQGSGRYVIDNISKQIWAICSNGPEIYIENISFGSVGDRHITKPFMDGTGDQFVLVDSDNGYIVSCICNKGISVVSDCYEPSNLNQNIVINIFVNSIPSPYILVRDEDANMLFILYMTTGGKMSIKGIKYDEVIKVEMIEDGNTVSSRSTSRTVGGAIIGGAVLGGAGAIVGGLSGNTNTNKKVTSIKLNILLRSAVDNCFVFELHKSSELNLSKSLDKLSYDNIMEIGNEIKNIFEVIIDKTDNDTNSIPKFSGPQSIADELSKLADLKERGILSDEEFNAEKKRLLYK